MNIKTPSDLKAAVSATGSCFFDRDSMKFFGDTMRNYGLRKTKILSNYDAYGRFCPEVIIVEVYCLYRKKATSKGATENAYFHMDTFRRAFPF